MRSLALTWSYTGVCIECVCVCVCVCVECDFCLGGRHCKTTFECVPIVGVTVHFTCPTRYLNQSVYVLQHVL